MFILEDVKDIDGESIDSLLEETITVKKELYNESLSIEDVNELLLDEEFKIKGLTPKQIIKRMSDMSKKAKNNRESTKKALEPKQ